MSAFDGPDRPQLRPQASHGLDRPPPAAPPAAPPTSPPEQRGPGPGESTAGTSATESREPATHPQELVRYEVWPVVRLARARIAGGAAAAGVLLAGAGSALSWLRGPDLDQVVVGISVLGEGAIVVGSRAGWAGGDALATSLLAFAALLPLPRALRGFAELRSRIWWLLCGVLLLGWALVGVAEAGRLRAMDGTPLDVVPASGPWLVAVGALAILAAAVLQPYDAEHELSRRLHRAIAYATGVDVARGVGEHQQVVRSAERQLGRTHPLTLVAWSELADTYAAIRAWASAAAALTTWSERLHEHTESAGGASLELAAWTWQLDILATSQPHLLGVYLPQVHRRAVQELGEGHPVTGELLQLWQRAYG